MFEPVNQQVCKRFFFVKIVLIDHIGIFLAFYAWTGTYILHIFETKNISFTQPVKRTTLLQHRLCALCNHHSG